jgi:hypothetical protein
METKYHNDVILPTKKVAGTRVQWSVEELNIIRFHFHEFFGLKKPPHFASVAAAQRRYKELRGRTREQTKTRVWHMIQTGH